MDILKQIAPNGSMLDFTLNLMTNIRFYIKNREALKDINISNEDLSFFVSKLEEVIKLYQENKIPNWFKTYPAYKFTSGKFPYFNAIFPWVLSFKEYVDILLKNGEVVDNTTIKFHGKIISVTKWRENTNE